MNMQLALWVSIIRRMPAHLGTGTCTSLPSTRAPSCSGDSRIAFATASMSCAQNVCPKGASNGRCVAVGAEESLRLVMP